MHALASPSEGFPKHSIYMQLDGAQAAHDEDGNDAGPPEVRLVPAEPSQSEFYRIQHAYCIHNLLHKSRWPSSASVQCYQAPTADCC